MMTLDVRTAERLRRRHGYRFRPARPDPVRRMIETAGGRLIPLNRSRPGRGLAYTSCPECGAEQAFWAEADGDWSRTCACRPRSGGPFELLAVLLTRDAS